MNKLQYIQSNTGLKPTQINNTLTLLEEGATIPFISRYRKELTQNLDEVEIANIQEKAKTFEAIENRKLFILKAIDEQGQLTPLLKTKIEKSFDIHQLEDLYLPFKSKRLTKGEKAKKAGLTSLAKLIMTQNNGDPLLAAEKFKTKDYPTADKALEGALHIIAEWINENDIVRDKLRKSFLEHGQIITKEIKSKTTIDNNKIADQKSLDKQKYRDVLEYSQRISNCPSYRLLAILRAEKEGFIRVKIEPNIDYSIQWLERFYIKSTNAYSDLVKSAISDAYKRLLQPSLETETKNYYKNLADEASIITFQKNLEKLLLAPPIGAKRCLAIDPGFRTGCKVVCLDESGKLVHNTTVYPHPPKNDKQKATAKIAQLVEMYKIQVIAIGDGTAGRETENWLKHIKFKTDVNAYVVREDGASIYSASKIAREEFPEYDVTVRGAVSIGRRVLDPLAELVKIDPKSLGVGQYQHDVNQLKLKNALDFVVESCVNKVGVNINTASKYLLSYVSGLGPKLAENIVNYREENGLFKSREDILKVPKMGAKSFEQAVGFLRIPQSKNPLDNSGVHPENYKFVEKIAKRLKKEIPELIGDNATLKSLNYDDFKDDIGIFTFNDILEELRKPGLDPRQKAKMFEFTPNIKTINDLKIGQIVNGVVTNVTDFGAFVNIGIKENGLIHKTQLSKDFVQNPIEVISIDDHITATVISLDVERKRIGLSLK
jgi:uncharacterized protein